MKLTFIVLYLSVALVAVTSALTVNPLQINCKQIDLRRNIADFTEDQLDVFFNAIQTLKDTPDPILPDTSIFDKYVKIHLDFAPKAHGSAHFLPWHRLFIREFELELQRVNPSVVLPFWNWAISSQSPERSIVFGKNYFGGTGDPSTGCVTTGRFANWQIRFPQKECLKRKFNGGTIIGAFTAPEILLRLIKESPSFENFASNLEAGAHARVHNGVGGTFAKMESNSDPLFYLHHANVDRLWSMYQNRGAKQAMEFNGKRPGDGGNATLNDVLMPFKKTVRQAMDMVIGLCYTYTQRRIPKPVKTAPIASRPVVTSSQIVPRSYSMPTPDEITPDISFKQEHTIATPNAMSHKEAAAGETRSNSARYVESQPRTNQKPNPPHVGKTSWVYTPYLLDPFDRSNLKRIRMPFTVPESWLKMNNISVDDYATKEAALIQEVKAYNARPQASVASLQFYKGNTSCDVISDKVYKAYGVPIPSKQSVQLTAPIGNVNFLSAEGITDLHLDPENLPAVDENGIRSHAPSSAPSISLAGVLATVLLSVNLN